MHQFIKDKIINNVISLLCLFIIYLALSFYATTSIAASNCATFDVAVEGTVNGCSTEDVEKYIAAAFANPAVYAFGEKAKSDFKAVCDIHDKCYYRLGTDKKTCDTDLNSAMKNVCESQYPDTWKRFSEKITMVPKKVEQCVKTAPLACALFIAFCGSSCIAKELVQVGVETVVEKIEQIVTTGPTAADLLLPGVSYELIKSAEAGICNAYRNAFNIAIAQDPANISTPGYYSSQKKTLDYINTRLGVDTNCDTPAIATASVQLTAYTVPVINANLTSMTPGIIDIFNNNTRSVRDRIATRLLRTYLKRDPNSVESRSVGGYDRFINIANSDGGLTCYPNLASVPAVTPPNVNVITNMPGGVVCVTRGTGDPNWIYSYVNSLYNNTALRPN